MPIAMAGRTSGECRDSAHVTSSNVHRRPGYTDRNSHRIGAHAGGLAVARGQMDRNCGADDVSVEHDVVVLIRLIRRIEALPHCYPQRVGGERQVVTEVDGRIRDVNERSRVRQVESRGIAD